MAKRSACVLESERQCDIIIIGNRDYKSARISLLSLASPLLAKSDRIHSPSNTSH